MSDKFNIILEINHGLRVVKDTGRSGVTRSYLSHEKYFPLWLGLGFRFYPERWSEN